MAGRKLIVEIVGDDRKLQSALKRSAAATDQFATKVGKSLGSGVSVRGNFEPLLARTREMQGRADDLSKQLAGVGGAATDAGVGVGRLTGGMGGLLARASLATIAISGLYTASRRLQESLQTTGTEAFTTGGKIKNFAAALLNTDLIGAFQALRAAPKTLEELGISTTEATFRLDALQKVANGTAERLREQGQSADGSKRDLEAYKEIVDRAGTSNRELARELVNAVGALRAAENAQNALADSTARLGTVFVTATGQAVAFKGAVDDLGGLRGPGLVDQINANLRQSRGGFGQQISPEAANAAAQTVAAAQGDLDKLLRLQKQELTRVTKVRDNSFAVGKEYEKLNQDVATARAAVISTTRSIKAQNQAAKQAAKAAADAAANAKAARISEHWATVIASLQLGVSRAELTPALKNDIVALRALEQGLRAQIRAGVDVSSAQAQLVRVIGEIGTKQAEIKRRRDKAAADALQASQFRALGLSAAGEDVIPTPKNLKKQFDQLSQRIDPSQLSAKLRQAWVGIEKNLSGDLGKLTEATREKIRDFFRMIRSEFGEGKGPLTTTEALRPNKILEGLGLSRGAEKELRARLSQFNSAGLARGGNVGTGIAAPRQPVTINTTVQLDGKVVGQNTKKFLLNDRRFNPPQKRGPNAG